MMHGAHNVKLINVQRSKTYFSISDVLIGSGAPAPPESETDQSPQFSTGIKVRGATPPVLIRLHGMVFN